MFRDAFDAIECPVEATEPFTQQIADVSRVARGGVSRTPV
jgi:hypothetical protein